MFHAVALLCLLSFTAATDLHALFGPSLSPSTEFFLPSDANYSQDVQQRWSSWDAPGYFGVIKPATEADVQIIVKVAYANHIPFLTTGAGHGTSTTYAALKNGLDIDLGNFKSVVVDAEANTVTVGGSVKFSDLYNPLFSQGKWMPTGSGTCIGVVGATLGAGVGPLQGLHGYDIDALLSVRMVTGTGDLITVSKTQHADLFWGIRGGGANFGIVTSATYQIYDTTNDGQVTLAEFALLASANRTVFELIASFDEETIPAELALSTVVTYVNETIGTVLVVTALYFGPQEEVMPYLTTIINAHPVRTNISMVPWNELFYSIAFGGNPIDCETNQYINLYTAGMKQNNAATYESVFGQVAEFFEETPTYHGVLRFERFPQQAVLAVPDGETAYPWRQTKTNINFSNAFAPGTDAAVDAFCSSAIAQFQKTSGYPYLSTYENYAHGDEGPQSWYSATKLPRLAGLKRQYDPHRLFGYDKAVPLQWP